MDPVRRGRRSWRSSHLAAKFGDAGRRAAVSRVGRRYRRSTAVSAGRPTAAVSASTSRANSTDVLDSGHGDVDRQVAEPIQEGPRGRRLHPGDRELPPPPSLRSVRRRRDDLEPLPQIGDGRAVAVADPLVEHERASDRSSGRGRRPASAAPSCVPSSLDSPLAAGRVCRHYDRQPRAHTMTHLVNNRLGEASRR